MSPRGNPAWTRLSMISCLSEAASRSVPQATVRAPQPKASTTAFLNIASSLTTLVTKSENEAVDRGHTPADELLVTGEHQAGIQKRSRCRLPPAGPALSISTLKESQV